MRPVLEAMGFTCEILNQPPREGTLPLMPSGSRIPVSSRSLGYGHGDAIRGLDDALERGAVALGTG